MTGRIMLNNMQRFDLRFEAAAENVVLTPLGRVNISTRHRLDGG